MLESVLGLFGAFGLLVPVVVLLVIVLYLVPIPLWIAAWASGAYVGLFTLVAMRLRRVPPSTIVTAASARSKRDCKSRSMIWKHTFWQAVMWFAWSMH